MTPATRAERKQFDGWGNGAPSPLHQSGPMSPAAPRSIDERLTAMAAAIRQLIPAAQVRLFGS